MVSIPPTIVTITLATISSTVRPFAVHFRGGKRVNQPFTRGGRLPFNCVAEVRGHRLDALEHAGGAAWIVLKVPQHLSEVLRPALQLPVIRRGHAQQLGGDDGGKRVRQVGDDVHLRLGGDLIDQVVGDLSGCDGGGAPRGAV